jgi:hypothetical protein
LSSSHRIADITIANPAVAGLPPFTITTTPAMAVGQMTMQPGLQALIQRGAADAAAGGRLRRDAIEVELWRRG